MERAGSKRKRWVPSHQAVMETQNKTENARRALPELLLWHSQGRGSGLCPLHVVLGHGGCLGGSGARHVWLSRVFVPSFVLQRGRRGLLAPGSQRRLCGWSASRIQNQELVSSLPCQALAGTGGSASREQVLGSAVDPTLAELGACPGVLPQSRTAWFLGDLSFPGQAETLLPPWGCHAFGGARSQACRRAAGIRPLPWEALLPHIPYLLSLQLRAVVSGQQQRPPRAQLLRSLGNHRLVRHEAGDGGRERAGGRPAQSIAAPLTPLEPAPPGAAWARGSGGAQPARGSSAPMGAAPRFSLLVARWVPAPHCTTAPHGGHSPGAPLPDPALPGYFPSPLSDRASPYPCNVKKEEECPGWMGTVLRVPAPG